MIFQSKKQKKKLIIGIKRNLNRKKIFKVKFKIISEKNAF